ncbi:MAG: YrhK family protein [Acidimicrobiia bacterium]|nr:YrhK family protein [Acidimicrobiia bacterium]
MLPTGSEPDLERRLREPASVPSEDRPSLRQRWLARFPQERIPKGWELLRARGPGPFVTRAVLRRADGVELVWTSRRHRKGLGLRGHIGAPTPSGRSHRLHRPSRSSLAMGGLFAVGSLCFAMASLPLVADRVSATAVAITFFVGSIFFTSAAALQYGEAVSAAPSPDGHHRHGSGGHGSSGHRVRRLLHLRPHRIDWWATLVQLVGTVWFNVTTFAGTLHHLTTDEQRAVVWVPDALGSICFLVASWLAYAEVNRGMLPRPDGDTGWWIGAVNLAGSVAFGVAAVASRITDDGQVANSAMVNGGTFAGAVCFFVGAVLLPVESARDTTEDAPTITN